MVRTSWRHVMIWILRKMVASFHDFFWTLRQRKWTYVHWNSTTVQHNFFWLKISSNPTSLVLGANEHVPPNQSSHSTVEPTTRPSDIKQAIIATSDYFESNGNLEMAWNGLQLPEQHCSSADVQSLYVELKSKSRAIIATKLVKTSKQNRDGQMFFPLTSFYSLVRKLLIPNVHVGKCLHHTATFAIRHCIYVVNTDRKTLFVVYFTFSKQNFSSHRTKLEKAVWPKMKLMDEVGKVALKIFSSPHALIFPLDTTVLWKTRFWGTFVQSVKNCDAF